jgi:hypothetical protein
MEGRTSSVLSVRRFPFSVFIFIFCSREDLWQIFGWLSLPFLDNIISQRYPNNSIMIETITIFTKGKKGTAAAAAVAGGLAVLTFLTPFLL